MNAYQYLLDFLYVLFVSNVNVIVLKIKELKVVSNSFQTKGLFNDKPNRIDCDDPINEAQKLYLNEKFLRVVKAAHETADSKSVVDRATKRPLAEVLAALNALDETNLADMRQFVHVYLHEPGVEIIRAQLPDWQETPAFISDLKSDHLKQFSLMLNRVWLDLYKKFDITKLDAGCVSSHLPMKHPFVVPGGRFIEIYYWDTYWTIEGLLVCGMFDTVRRMLENFIHFIRQFGFIPNGSRVYYLNRSQPPYFTQMCMRYYEFCQKSNDLDDVEKQKVKNFVLNDALEAMVAEYDYWMQQKLVTVYKGNKAHRLNVYKADTQRPRPESYREDLLTAGHLSSHTERAKLYEHIATAAESGYDFSSRWFKEPHNMHTIQTSDVIPVDLNAIMYKSELILAKLTAVRGDRVRSRLFKTRALKRKQAINEIMWSRTNLCWCDYNMSTHTRHEQNFYVSNLAPLWMGMRPPKPNRPAQIIDKHRRILSDFAGGVPVSLVDTDEQWDFANVWAPNQHSLISMLLLDHVNERQLALNMARRFFNSVYAGWSSTGMIFEKYSTHSPGERGSGGEYEVQSGFGWTNGVILNLIHTFKDELIEQHPNATS